MSSKKLVWLGDGIWLYDFEWACGWYWAGGYIGNSRLHTHFDGCFLNVPDRRGHCLGIDPSKLSNGASVWEDLSFFFARPNPELEANWWRIKDLFKQFYALKKAAEVFRLGGHCTSKDRSPREIVPEQERAINDHIRTVIIPEIYIALGMPEREVPAML